MQVEKINALYVELQKLETKRDRLCDRAIVLGNKLQKLQDHHADALDTWAERVVDLGRQLDESRTDYGIGWKRDFEKLGYTVSYVTAMRYISCSKHPGLFDDNPSLEDWASAAAEADRVCDPVASAKEARRIERKSARAVKSHSVVKADEVELAAAPQVEKLPRSNTRRARTNETQVEAEVDQGAKVNHPGQCEVAVVHKAIRKTKSRVNRQSARMDEVPEHKLTSQVDAQCSDSRTAYVRLDSAIRSDARYSELKADWMTLSKIICELLPLDSTVSPESQDDLVVSAG